MKQHVKPNIPKVRTRSLQCSLYLISDHCWWNSWHLDPMTLLRILSRSWEVIPTLSQFWRTKMSREQFRTNELPSEPFQVTRGHGSSYAYYIWLIEIDPCAWSRCSYLVKTHCLICDVTFSGHHVALTRGWILTLTFRSHQHTGTFRDVPTREMRCRPNYLASLAGGGAALWAGVAAYHSSHK